MASQPSLSRRSVVGWLVAAPTLTVAVRLGVDQRAPAAAAVPSTGPAEVLDLGDSQTLAAMPTSHLISMELRPDGTVHFAIPRMEVGQGITTSTAMIIADELDVPVENVVVTLADARPELVFNQLTGGSNTTMSTYYPIRTAAALARQRLLEAAASLFGDVPITLLRTVEGMVQAPDGRSVSYGDLATAAASDTTQAAGATLKDDTDLKVIGTPQGRIDAHDIVTGRKTFAMDLKVPGALPCMICRAPTLNGTPVAINNRAAVLAMPGVTHVEMVPAGVAVRARTFGQCIDAIQALDVQWKEGPLAGMSDADVLAKVRKAEIPLAVPALGTLSVETDLTFWHAGNSALETNCAVADVRDGRAEIWGGFKSPIVAQERIAQALGMSIPDVTVHVVLGGGSFGRKLFWDAGLEAAICSKRMGVPVRLMWHRADDARQGRVHPLSTSRVRATYPLGQVLTYEQRHTSAKTDFTMGYGDLLTGIAGQLPVGDIGLSETVYALSQATHYNFGVTTNLLDEVDLGFNTGAMRNIYSPNVATAREITVDKLATAMKKDPVAFRREFTREARSQAVIDAVAKAGDWGRTMEPGTAQGFAIHNEYHGFTACLVELDCRPETVGRVVRDAVTGPRVTKVVFGVDVGLVVNPKGLEAQMMGGIMDGIALALTSSMHLQDGYFLEASWDNYAYTREWNVPPQVEILIMPSNGTSPGGAGELGVASAMAAVANAYRRATGTEPTAFPINHDAPLHFVPKPTIPPVPQSPTNGLDYVTPIPGGGAGSSAGAATGASADTTASTAAPAATTPAPEGPVASLLAGLGLAPHPKAKRRRKKHHRTAKKRAR